MGIGLVLIIAGFINMMFSGMNAFSVSAVIIGGLIATADLAVHIVFPAASKRKATYIRIMMIALAVIITAITAGIPAKEYDAVKGRIVMERSCSLIDEGNEGKAQELLLADSAYLRYFPEFYLNLGTALVLQEKYDEYARLPSYGGAIAECSYLPEYCSNTGLALYKKGDFPNAQAYFDRVLIQEPENYEALLYKAICCIETGTWREADYDLKLLRQYFPETAEVHYWSGVLYYKIMDFPRSEQELEIVLNTGDCPVLKDKAEDILEKIKLAAEPGIGGYENHD